MSVLPTTKIAATRVNPKVLLLYGSPKVGKTKILTQLPGCLILDTEGGADMYDAHRIRINSVSGIPVRKVKTAYIDKQPVTVYYKGVGTKQTVESDGKIVSTSFDQVCADIIAEAARQRAAGEKMHFPFKYIAIDTIDELEDMCETLASDEYHRSTLGKNFDGDSVLELPKGSGYFHLREKVKEKIKQLSPLCEYVILISHLREKLLNSKEGIDVVAKDISLTGKLSSIVCSMADTIGYLYREPGKPLMVSFETFENATMGSRFDRLAGKRMEFDWSKIYVPESNAAGNGVSSEVPKAEQPVSSPVS